MAQTRKAAEADNVPVKEPEFAFNFALRPRQVAKALGISNATLYRWVASGMFPKPHKLGLSMSFWRTSTVNAWLDQQKPK
jgi:excisionase family DNA binding protein